MPSYVPRQGDLVSVTLDPQSGHEQKGRRSAIVVSKTTFNRHTGMALLCPITNTNREYPFHVPLDNEGKVTGFVMVEQIKSVDFRARSVKYITKASDNLLDEVLSLLDACIY
ncbi:MAG: type II toxin-antitoxin system PemK/MazF family toxin [Candidatus Hydrogenedentes bacterium]|nr:type II toxin-antitoxin system PemK/MazF family toxin [Candidatus Hydrogenedentota bacterium]